MIKPITSELIAAWRTLQDFAQAANPDSPVKKAIDVLDNSNYMVPIEQAGLCGYQVSGSYLSPPEYCELEIEGTDEYCPRHQKLADADSALDPAEWGGTTREDMAAHQVGLPELKPGQEPRPAFSDTHPRAARELGELIAHNEGHRDTYTVHPAPEGADE